MELIHKLGIDWKLLVAQIINFAILIFVLYKFVYRPLLATLDKRSQMIDKGIKDAQESEHRLGSIKKLEEEKMAEAHREIGRIMELARKDAEEVKKDLIATATAQSQELLKRAQMQIEEQKQAMLAEIRGEVVEFIIKASAKVMGREFTSEDQKRLMHAISNEMKSTTHE